MINKKDWVECYNKTGKLPSLKLPCTTCDGSSTCFGSNLDGKIKKYGGLDTLLDTFKCRSCVSASKPKKEKKVSVRLIKRKEKEAKKELPIPQVKQFVPRNVLLKDAPDLQDSMSASGSCLRPDIFLNSGRACDSCPYVENCNATCKTLKYVAA
jgi:hypothetical protein